jgi:hypothetical protein
MKYIIIASFVVAIAALTLHIYNNHRLWKYLHGKKRKR